MPARTKVEFAGHAGHALAGLLEHPDAEPVGTVLFAHCFTCGKDVAAASRIARAMVARGFAVLRFDFTGLGNSDGDFANTHFSSNVADLVAAADHLRDTIGAPTLLIGHSLGGTAVLNAAHRIPEARGVVTIGAPADARHVAGQFACDIETIEREGVAEVSLAGRPFTIRREFLEDIRATDATRIGELDRALLVMHSPVDIAQAEAIYRAAMHPKSFVDLGTSDHLLSKAADAEWVATIVSAWASRLGDGSDLPRAIRPAVARGELVVDERDRKFALDLYSDDHHVTADEPTSLGGSNSGPDPYELLLASLGSCTAMTLRMYAGRKGWPLEKVRVRLHHAREHETDCEGCEETPAQLDVLTREIELHGELDETQRASLMRIADRCPVHRTLEGRIEVRTVTGSGRD